MEIKYPLLLKKCLAPDCPRQVADLACDDHQDLAAELVAECDGGIPYVANTRGGGRNHICDNHLVEWPLGIPY